MLCSERQQDALPHRRTSCLSASKGAATSAWRATCALRSAFCSCSAAMSCSRALRRSALASAAVAASRAVCSSPCAAATSSLPRSAAAEIQAISQQTPFLMFKSLHRRTVSLRLSPKIKPPGPLLAVAVGTSLSSSP